MHACRQRELGCCLCHTNIIIVVKHSSNDNNSNDSYNNSNNSSNHSKLLLRKAKKRISDEIQMLKNLKHPKIITFINAWTNKEQEKARATMTIILTIIIL